MASSARSAIPSTSATNETELWSLSPKLWQPHAGQKLGVKWLLEHACGALFADPGVGKTSIVYAALKMLKKRGLVNKVLVIAPLRVAYSVWPGERDKWIDFRDFRVEVLHGPKKEEALARDADIYVINPEGLDWLLETQKKTSASGRLQVTVDVAAFKAMGFDTLVIDELSKFKHISSGRHKALKEVIGTFSRRWGLTGSPSANGLMDLFGEMYMIDQGRTFGPYITHFRSNYFLPSYNGFGWDIKRGSEELIYEKIAPLALRLDAKDYIDMPGIINNKLMFDLPPDLRLLYDTLEDDMVARFGDDVFASKNAAGASIKLRQVTSGGIYSDPSIADRLAGLAKKTKRDWVPLHELKTDLLEDLVDQLQGKPLFVAYDFRHDLERLQARFGKDVPYLGEGVSAKRAADLEALWNKGRLPLLLGQPQSVAHGLNLQESSQHVCWHSMTFNYELYDQFIRRVWRQGNAHDHVFVHHLLARKTVDEIMYWVIEAKGARQTRLHDALRAMRLKRGRK